MYEDPKRRSVMQRPAEIADAPEPIGAQGLDVLDILRRRKWLIGAVVTAVTAIGMYFALTAEHRYTAYATIMLQPASTNFADLESVTSGFSGNSREIRSQMQVIRSRRLLGRVVDTLDLTADPEFNSALVDPEKTRSRFSIGYLLELVGVRQPPSRAMPAPEQLRDNAIDALGQRLTVVPVQFSMVFTIGISSTTPDRAKLIANTLADEFILDQIEMKFEATEAATVWLSQRVTELRADLEAAEAALARHMAESGLADADVQMGAIVARLGTLREGLANAIETRTGIAARRERAETLLAAGDALGAARVIDTRTLSLLTDRLARATSAEAEAAVREQLGEELAAEIAKLAADEARLGTTIENFRRSITELDSEQSRTSNEIILLGQLQREAESASVIYETFLNLLKEVTVQQGIQQADAVVISEAQRPRFRSYPVYKNALGASMVVGLILAGALVLLLESIARGFRTARDLERFSGHQVLSTIPRIPIARRSNVLKYLQAKPVSGFAESIRNLRSSIQLMSIDDPIRVVAITSAVESEGKTNLSLALASVSATLGSVIVIDCDLRRRNLSRQLRERRAKTPGLIAHLMGEAELEDCITRDEENGFDVLAVEHGVEVTTDFFTSQRFANMLARFKQHYGLIVLDTPPLLGLPDARVLAPQVDLILMAVRWQNTSRSYLREALTALRLAKPRQMGLVLNNVDMKHATGYKYYYGYS